jgi:hypothetical protein
VGEARRTWNLRLGAAGAEEVGAHRSTLAEGVEVEEEEHQTTGEGAVQGAEELFLSLLAPLTFVAIRYWGRKERQL